MFILIACIILVIAAVVVGLLAGPGQFSHGWVAVPLILAVVLFLAGSFTQVHAKEIGVKVSFGKPVAEFGPGVHAKWPWQSVTKIDETIVTDTYNGNSVLPVRLGDGQTASVNATIRWHIDPTAADYIYQNYRSTDHLHAAVVDTQFQAVVNQVFSGYNPTADVKNANFNPNYPALAEQITAEMQNRVKDASGTPMVVIDGITIAGVQYSQVTEDRISSIMAQSAKTQQAVLSEQTAQAQAKANQILENSLKNDPYVLVSKCMDMIANKDFVPPAGFSCWPNSGSALVLPQASK